MIRDWIGEHGPEEGYHAPANHDDCAIRRHFVDRVKDRSRGLVYALAELLGLQLDSDDGDDGALADEERADELWMSAEHILKANKREPDKDKDAAMRSVSIRCV